MLRSLTAVIVATIVGLAAAKLVELAGVAGLALEDATKSKSSSAAYRVLMVAAWGVGAFAAAMTALVIGRRWAPLGWLAAATILFSAFMTMMTFALGWVLWPASGAATAFGGFLAIRLLRASNAPPARDSTGSLFGE